jgi:signal peptidase II
LVRNSVTRERLQVVAPVKNITSDLVGAEEVRIPDLLVELEHSTRRGKGEMQANVSASGRSSEKPERARHRRSYASFWRMLGLVTVPVVVLDQFSKLYIASHLPLYRTIPIVPDWLDLTFTLNPGAAFSLFATMPARLRHLFFVVLSLAAMVVLLVLLARRRAQVWSNIAFALILGGTIGNLIDRLARGRVIDFIYFHHESFSYPVFNLADSAITIGVAIILIESFFSGSASQRAPY